MSQAASVGAITVYQDFREIFIGIETIAAMLNNETIQGTSKLIALFIDHAGGNTGNMVHNRNMDELGVFLYAKLLELLFTEGYYLL